MKRPKCPRCSKLMIKMYIRYYNGNGYKPIGYICPNCNGFKILEKPNKLGWEPVEFGTLLIGLQKL